MTAVDATDRTGLKRRWRAVRRRTEDLAAPLSPEDQVIQSMTDASPTKWHLGHVTWFFEAMVLARAIDGYRPFDERFLYIFNSYYEALGPRHPRPRRGMLTRPPVARVMAYRHSLDAAVERLIDTADGATWKAVAPLIALGMHHEQQHQELILTDIKHALSCNPLETAYDAALPMPPVSAGAPPMRWVEHPGGLVEIGHGADACGFAYDNEGPRHRRWLEPFRLASRPVTCGEYLAFMEDGGYARPDLWLSDGWAVVQAEGRQAPLYWQRTNSQDSGGWQVFTLGGLRRLALDEPVTHVGFFEAAAYAEWAGARLPTEAEWEVIAATRPPAEGNFACPGAPLHPRPAARAADGHPTMQMFGDVWEWTRSAYEPYPGFRPLPGVAAEYNGKFMSGQMVLRGGSCATPADHVRATYRNFFPPDARWQFSGIRLAEDT